MDLSSTIDRVAAQVGRHGDGLVDTICQHDPNNTILKHVHGLLLHARAKAVPTCMRAGIYLTPARRPTPTSVPKSPSTAKPTWPSLRLRPQTRPLPQEQYLRKRQCLAAGALTSQQRTSPSTLNLPSWSHPPHRHRSSRLPAYPLATSPQSSLPHQFLASTLRSLRPWQQPKPRQPSWPGRSPRDPAPHPAAWHSWCGLVRDALRKYIHDGYMQLRIPDERLPTLTDPEQGGLLRFMTRFGVDVQVGSPCKARWLS